VAGEHESGGGKPWIVFMVCIFVSLGLGYAFLSFGACLVFVKTLMTEEIVKIYDYNQPGLRGMRG
jgi:hypothetical protein